MNTITLKRLKLQNFKGTEKAEYYFANKTDISGRNKSGKTTLINAVIWLLFGKDKHDRKDFEIKTKLKDGKVKHNIQHSVEATLSIAGKDVIIKRIYVEKWQKIKGSETPELTGHKTEYFINDIPYTQGEYQNYINLNVCDELTFKVLSNPLFFNTLDWKVRREILTTITGGVSDEELSVAGFGELLKRLAGVDIALEKRKTQTQIKDLRVLLDSFPVRIDEVEQGKPEPVDVDEIQAQIKQHQQSYDEASNALEAQTKANQAQIDQVKQAQIRKHELEAQIQNLVHAEVAKEKANNAEIQNEITECESKIKSLATHQQRNGNEIKKHEEECKRLQNENNALREKWAHVNAQAITFDDAANTCPTCKRGYDEGHIRQSKEQQVSRFNESKRNELARIQDVGQRNKIQIEQAGEKINYLISENEMLGENIAELTELLKAKKLQLLHQPIAIDTPQIIELRKQLEAFVVPKIKETSNDEAAKKQKQAAERITELKLKLSINDYRDKADARIAELKKEQKKTAQNISDLQKQEFEIDELQRTKFEIVEKKVNALFDTVQFKMFNQQLNGGIEDVCECLIGGVPFDAANDAAQINSGIEIINVLNNYYKTSLPVLVDNCESINEISQTSNQIITTRVTLDDKLKVVNIE